MLCRVDHVSSGGDRLALLDQIDDDVRLAAQLGARPEGVVLAVVGHVAV